MSLLSHSELCIVIHPGQLVLLNAVSKLTPRGLKRHVHAQANIPCGAAVEGDMPWGAALRALETTLPYFAQRHIKTTVILSNHFVHYLLVPWCDKLDSEKEEMAYVRHCFGEVYGDAAEGWELRLSPGKAGAAALASALDKRLLDDLHSLLGRAEVALKSVQPHLMAAHNICHDSLQGRDTWLALLEPGNLCLAMLQQGQWSWIRKMRIGEAWCDELPAILEREEHLAGIEASGNEVLLWAPHLRKENGTSDSVILAAGRWGIRQLNVIPAYGFGLEHGGLLGMAAGA